MIPRGWECPRCLRVNAPHLDHCTCGPGDSGAGPSQPLGRTAGRIAAVLREAGEPLTVPEIVRRMVAAGYCADAGKAKGAVTAVLYRAAKHESHPVFRQVGRGLFEACDLTEKP